MKRSAIVAAITLALAATAAGVLRATVSRAHNVPPAVQAFLNAKLTDLPQLNSATLGPPKPDYPGTQYLYVTATANDTPTTIKAEWEAGLLAAALADSGLTTVDGFLVTVNDPSGNALEINGTEIPAQPIVPVSISTEAALTSRFPGAQFLHVDKLEAVIHAQTSDGASFAANYPAAIESIVGNDQGYDGRLLEVDDLHGAPVAIQADVDRLDWRMTWISPAYRGNPAFSLSK
jgi:hypothetical protein